jgi:threonine dehydratase
MSRGSDPSAVDPTLPLPDATAIDAAAQVVYAAMPPTPQFAWPQLAAALGTEVWVKHENHTPLGAFKVRGGLTYLAALEQAGALPRGLIGATRGNHGQSIAFAARRHGLPAWIVVPEGNSREKNAAMRALGAELIEHGADFQAAREEASRLAAARELHLLPSFHPALIGGVATYWAEFFRGTPALDVVYVPIGQGSGITACVAARNALAPRTRIVGVVSAHAPCYLRSLAAGRLVEAPVTTRLADGLACRVPEAASLAIVQREVERVLEVTDIEVAAAMRLLFSATHNVAEGAGAASLAAAWQERARVRGRRIGVTLCGGNVDADMFARVLAADDTWLLQDALPYAA